MLLGFVLLALLGLRFLFFYKNQPRYRDGQEVKLAATLLSEPQVAGNTQRFYVNGILINIPKFPQYHYGDIISIFGAIKAKNRQGISSKNTKLLTDDKVVLTMYFPKIEAVKKDHNSLLAVTSFIRQKVISLFEKTLPPASSSLFLGIVFGIKQNLPKAFAEDLRTSGVLHVVAASGMNVAMAGGFLSAVFALIFRRQIALALSILGILFYALLAGLEPSIIRASIMGILVFSAQILGRQTLSLYGLFMAGFLMIFINPSLLSDVGFQLSFMATLGLLYIRPILQNGASLIGEDLATTTAAQAATLPILLANFGSYSLWSVVVNGLVLWSVPVLMVLGALAAVTGIVFEPLGKIFLYLGFPFLLYFQQMVSLFANFGGSVKLDFFPWQFVLGYYCFLAAAIIFFIRKR